MPGQSNICDCGVFLCLVSSHPLVCVCVFILLISLFFLLSSLSIVLQCALFQALDLKFNFCQVCHNITIISMTLLSFSFIIFFRSTCMQDVIPQIREKMISEIRTKTLV